MATSPPLEVVPPVDGLDLLVDGGEFLIVRVQDHQGERVRIGIQDSTVRVLLAVRPRANRARFFVVLAGVMAGVALAFLVPVGVGLSPLLAFAMAFAVGLIGLVVVLMAQPVREYYFHDDLPGGLERPALMVLAERTGQQAWYALRDEQGRVFGDISRRLGKWRVRGFEPIDPPEPASDDEARATGSGANVTGRLYAWSVAMADDQPQPSGATTEVSVSIERNSMTLAALVGGLISGPLGLAMAANGPWRRMEFRRAGAVVARGHRLDDGGAMRLAIEPAFDTGSEVDAWLDRRHLLALAVLSLSFEAER
jgi:hypothetical protein